MTMRRFLIPLLMLVLASLSSASEPVPRVAVVSIELAQVPNLAKAAAERLRGRMRVDLFGLGQGLLPSVREADLGTYDLVIVEGVGPQLLGFSAQFEAAAARTRVLVVNGERWIRGNVETRALPDLQSYWTNATEENYVRLFDYLAARVLQLPRQVLPPQVYPERAFYHPDAPSPFEEAAAYERWESARVPGATDRPRIAILFYRSLALARNTGVIDALIREVERQGGFPVPVWRKESAASLGAVSRVDAVILCGNWIDYQDHSAGVKAARRLDVPVLSCATDYTRSLDEWERQPGGFAPSQSGQLALSESEGIVEPMMVGVRTITAEGTTRYEPIAHQVQWRVARAMRWARLRHLENPAKRVVIAYYSEGQNNADVGSDPDTYLDAQGSLVALLNRLKSEGYDVGSDPLPDKAVLTRMLAERGSNPRTEAEIAERVRSGDAVVISEAQYREWWRALPATARKVTEARWGKPPTHSLVIPILRFGKVALVPHPIWGFQEESALKELGALPPHHQYIAFYNWMQKVWQADAYLPVFTQLSLMPGKQEGPSSTDWVGLLIGDLPHIQPTPLQANGGIGNKRRTNAVLVGFMPELTRAGLPPELATLSRELRLASNDRTKRTGVRESAARLNLAPALGMDPRTAEWSAVASALTLHLDEIARAPMPHGGHVLGNAPSADVTASMVHAMLGDGTDVPSVDEVRAVLSGKLSTAPESLRRRITEFAARVNSAPRELDALIAALDGRYIEPGPNQDAIRNPDALPGGRNPYTFDARALPTPQAWSLGSRLADELIASHRTKHQALPRKVAFVLWSSETVQNGGVLEAQILRLLGARPVWNAKGQVTDVAIDTQESLGRQRVDVFVTTSGTYRDHFSDRIALLAKAVRLAAEQDEPDNPIRVSVLERERTLLAQGMSREQARAAALRRVFSTAPGAYSPATEFAVKTEKRWSDARLAKLYSDRMSFAYGDGDDGLGDPASFSAQLKTVDSAVLSRTSNVYGLLDTPMAAAYLGGIGMAVRTETGRKIDTYVAQLQSPERAHVESIDRTLGRELRSRYFNPAWIEAMKQSGYNGARYMSGLTENLLFWDITSPDLVTDADWNEVFDVYVRDRYELGLQEYFEKQNPGAREQLTRTLLEAADRGHWRAPSESLARLRAELSKSTRQSTPGAAPAPGAAPKAAGTSSVKGFEMQTTSQTPPSLANAQPLSWLSLWVAILGFGIVAAGALRREAW